LRKRDPATENVKPASGTEGGEEKPVKRKKEPAPQGRAAYQAVHLHGKRK
jgi:hypothetical protein